MKKRSPRVDHHQKIVDVIISQLADGVLPWHKPWRTADGVVSKPLRENGVPYQGINILTLWAASIEGGFMSPYWMTYRQAKEHGGQVRKGETATHVFFAKQLKPRPNESEDEEKTASKPTHVRRAYAVFNTSQIDGLPSKYDEMAPFVNPDERDEHCANWFARLDVDVRHGGDRACYNFLSDTIRMPSFEAFKSANDYYAALGHEAVHSTGASHRLDRSFGSLGGFGSRAYAREELVAELGSAFLCADLGISSSPREDHASYLATWLRLLKDEPRALFEAASLAQRAVEYLHGLGSASDEDAAAQR